MESAKVIADIGCNHIGKIDVTKEMIETATGEENERHCQAETKTGYIENTDHDTGPRPDHKNLKDGNPGFSQYFDHAPEMKPLSLISHGY